MRTPERGKKTRKERERERHRREIMEAAERVFVRKGYYAATVEEIAHEAEFAVGTLYNFFKSKDDLYACMVEKIVHDLIKLFEERVLNEPDPESAIAALIRLRLAHFDEHRELFRVFLEASPGNRLDPAGALPESCSGWQDWYVDAVTGIFARGVRGGQFDDVDPFYLALCLEGVINAFAVYWAKRTPEEPLETRVNKLTETFVGRIRRRAQAGEKEASGQVPNPLPDERKTPSKVSARRKPRMERKAGA